MNKVKPVHFYMYLLFSKIPVAEFSSYLKMANESNILESIFEVG